MSIFISPIAFFQGRLESSPSWLLAATPLLLLVVGSTSSASIMLLRSHLPGMDAVTWATVGVLFISVCFGESLAFWLSTGAIAALDMLFAGSNKERRIIELSALSCWPRAIWNVLSVGLVWAFFRPEPPNVSDRMTTIQLQQALLEYQASVESTDFMLTLSLLGTFAAAFVVALQCCILRVVSRFSVAGCWATGIVLGLVFVGIPWAFQRFW